MAVIENLVEILPDIGVTICRHTYIFKVLLQRIKAKKFDANKLYASELLSILLQSSPHEEASDPDTGEVRATLQTDLCNVKLQEKDDVSDGMVLSLYHRMHLCVYARNICMYVVQYVRTVCMYVRMYVRMYVCILL